MRSLALFPRAGDYSVGFCVVLVAAASLVAGGCSKSDANKIKTYAVRGQVTLEGQPVPGAFVVLHPQGVTADTAAAAPTARGQTGADGRFQLTTFASDDGAPAGQYAVTVVHHPTQDKDGSIEPGPNVLPPRYASPKTTNLHVSINPAENDLPPLALSK
ncbi:MAG: carboxypeptidase-like regulatory domain-containing protein [Planctomycetia bacterium]|nr:carboxypeptidase-like regulatory domain-containing protein [Planctomycetia bacterium]